MRTVRFLTAASLLAALLIAGLTWAWWPRPVKTISFNCEQSYSHFQLNPVAAFGETDQLEIAMGGGSGTHWLLRGDRNFGPRLRTENEHALGFDPHGNFWFVRHAGNLTSPSFAAVATLNPARRSDDADYSLMRYDFLSGLEHRAVPVDRATFLGLTLSADRSTAAVAYGGDDSPLRIEIHDLPSGAVRRTMTFPDRIGSLAFRRKRVAAAGWMLSPNGDRLLLAEGWHGLKRTTPEGPTVYDTSTGTLLRRIDTTAFHRWFRKVPSSAEIKTDFGSRHFRSTFEGRAVYMMVDGRSTSADGWDGVFLSAARCTFNWDDGDFRETPFPTGTKGVDVVGRTPDSRITLLHASESGILTVRNAESGRTIPIPEPVIEDKSSSFIAGQFHRAKPYVCFVRPMVRNSDDTFLGRRLDTLWSRPPMSRDFRRFYLFDWESGELRAVRTLEEQEGGQDCNKAEFHGDRLVLLTKASKEPFAFALELWDVPVRREPWAWTVPAGVLSFAVVCVMWVGIHRKRMTM